MHFTGSDTLELYEKNLASQPQDWLYRDYALDYQFNSQGYRYDQFDTVDWSVAVLLLGCSMVMGVGVAREHTIGQQLASLLDRPVVNLGLGGSSCWFSYHNSLLARRRGIRPYAVVQLWTEHSRTLHYSPQALRHSGVWSGDPLYELWNDTDLNSMMHVAAIAHSDRLAWRDCTRYYAASLFGTTARMLDVTWLNIPESIMDYARDFVHYGPVTNRWIAEHIAAKLAV
jgi:hypothetical protein